MKTITIQIGNSDDKLTQAEWAEYVMLTGNRVKTYSHEIHFFGASSNWEKWQNAAWICTIKNDIEYAHLKREVSRLRSQYKQDSAGWTEGETKFI